MSATRQSDKSDQSGSGVPPLNQKDKQSRDGSTTLAAPTGRVSRMDESLSRSKNGAVNVGNTDLILPVRVRTCAENVGKTPGAFPLRGSVARAFQRWSVAKRPASVTPKGGALA